MISDNGKNTYLTINNKMQPIQFTINQTNVLQA